MQLKANESAQNFISEGNLKLERLDFQKKFYTHDPELWKKEKEHTDIIKNSLGWTDVYDWTLERAGEIINFAEEMSDIFDYVVVLGMGGSSLAPEVFKNIFGKKKSYPELIILDSTNADRAGAVRKEINIKKTLFIFASKSGGTVEPASLFAYFYDELEKEGVDNPGDNFIAITDPGTGLEALAQEKYFRKIFVNKADIGGRFSALSYFGMVPAALAGIDIKKILLSAKNFAEKYNAEIPLKNDPSFCLGALMATASLKMKDKLTLVLPPAIDSFGLWIEQLVGESTGKEGKGVVPVAGKKTYKHFDYKDDRTFVYISAGSMLPDKTEQAADALFESGHPMAEMEMKDLYDIGAQMLIWERATAAAGALLGVNPFDQPNVQEAKTLAKKVLEDLQSGKEDPAARKPLLVSSVFEDGEVKEETLAQDLFSVMEANDYFALLAYVNETKETEEILSALKDKIFSKIKRAVVFGYGPRYLHSTGQLHKGGANNGVFLIISADADNDVKIPGVSYTFGELASAQALGDFKALDAKGRRVIKIHLKSPVIEGLKKLSGLF